MNRRSFIGRIGAALGVGTVVPVLPVAKAAARERLRQKAQAVDAEFAVDMVITRVEYDIVPAASLLRGVATA